MCPQRLTIVERSIDRAAFARAILSASAFGKTDPLHDASPSWKWVAPGTALNCDPGRAFLARSARQPCGAAGARATHCRYFGSQYVSGLLKRKLRADHCESPGPQGAFYRPFGPFGL